MPGRAVITAFAASSMAVSGSAAMAYDIGALVDMFERDARERCGPLVVSRSILRDQIAENLGIENLSGVEASDIGLPWWYLPTTAFRTWMSTSKEDRITLSTFIVASHYLESLLEVIRLSEEPSRNAPDFREKQGEAIERASELLELVNCLRVSDDERQWLSGWVRAKYDPSVGVMECGQWFDAAPELFDRLAKEPPETHLDTFNELIGLPTKKCREGTLQ